MEAILDPNKGESSLKASVMEATLYGRICKNSPSQDQKWRHLLKCQVEGDG
jgi:hypothetical protein